MSNKKSECILLLLTYNACVFYGFFYGVLDVPCSLAEITEISTKHIEEQCIQKCPDQNRTNSDHIDCGQDCYISQCTLGCKLWEQALESSCKEVCTNKKQNGPNELYCVMGCNNALNRYFNWLIDEVGTPSAPALVADTLTATSLSLEWEIPPRLAQITQGRPYITKSYLVQWRYEEVMGDWKFCRNQSIGTNSTVRVDNLQPYTKYRFRVALILSAHHEKELFSEQSVIISTLPLGVPLSEPAIDIPASDNFFLVEKLLPDTDYIVSVTMRNAVGEGPAAMTVVRTPLAPEIRIDEPKTTLILGAEYSVLSQGIDLLSDPAQIIYNSDGRILGIAIHIFKKLLFVCDDTGYIYKASLEIGLELKKDVVLTPESNRNFAPSIISMDWLNDHIYMLVQVQTTYQRRWQISRCDLNGERLTVVIAGLRRQPSHIEVDPYNGYLFWVVNDGSHESGLFRLDLGDVSNGVKHEVIPLTMLSDTDLGAFAIDYIRFKILVPIQDNNTVLSMDLDGKKKEDIRKNTQSPKFRVVKSLAMANQIFYWTNGEDVLNEEYHTIEKNYYHNAYPDLSNRTFAFVRINHTSAQPIPVPVNPPSNVQALLSVKKGIISWHVPHLLGIQGKSAWQEWNYLLEITDEDDGNNTITFGDIKETQHTVDKLKPNTSYKFRAAAYTSAGRGPWSTEFRTRTLKSLHDRYLIWSSNEGLLQSDVLGEHIHQLIPKSQIANQNISDIAWLEDMVYFVSNFTLRYYNRTSGYSNQLHSLDWVQSIAIDWIGRRLYWFNTLTQFIIRSNMSGYAQEPLVSLAARDIDLKIDSLRGYMYFSTGHAVEYCRLNGKQRKEYYIMEVYSGRQVMGLTLDMDNERVYWIVRSYDGSSLFSAPMAGAEHSPLQEFLLQDKTLQGPLTYFSDRLLWLQDEHTVIIGNVTGKNLAHIKNSRLIGLKAFSVIDPTHHVYPAIETKVNVIPEQITDTSIQVDGTWKSFDISWDAVKDVTYGDVFYEIRFLGNVYEVNEPIISYTNESLLPYMPLHITVRAFTYWASSKLTKVYLYTPAAPPSAPTNCRVFLTRHQNPIMNELNVRATFRWSAPLEPNGPISGYKVYCWYEEDGREINVCDENEIEHPNIFEKSIENLLQNETYFFRVQANSTAGLGENGTIVEVVTSDDKPIPSVLVVSGEEIFKVDLDLKKTLMIVNTGNKVTHLAYIENETRLFWITDNNELISYSGMNKNKLLSIQNPVLSLVVDWVERVLYWSCATTTTTTSVSSTTATISNNNESEIYMLDLNKYEGEGAPPTMLLKRSGLIYSLLISPLHRVLFWVESEGRNSTSGILYNYNLSSKIVSSFFTNDHPTIISNSLLADISSTSDFSLIWSDANSLQFYSTDIRSNNTSPLLNLRHTNEMTNLAKDSGRIYWTENETLFAVNTFDFIKYEIKITNLQRIFAFYYQKYPSKRCLLPAHWYSDQYIPSLMDYKEKSLILTLPSPKMHGNCKLKLVGKKYIILYKPVENADDREKQCTMTTCNSTVSFENIKEITNLKSFMEYKFQISVTNFYAEKINTRAIFGPIVTFRTAIGAPTAPRNFTAEAISPTEAIVQWLPPLELNSDSVSYEVHWQTDHAINGVTNRQQQRVNAEQMVNDNSMISMNITRLLPNQSYSVWIRAHTSSTMFNESGPVKIETLPEPENITIIDASPYSLRVHWVAYQNISQYILEYRPIGSLSSTLIYDSTNDSQTLDNEKNYFTVENLQPKTLYKFSILLYFNKKKSPYRWPQDSRFVFETLGDKPTAPGQPIIRHVSGDVYKVSWEAAKENGAFIEEYSLEALQYKMSNRMARSAAEYIDDTLNYTTMLSTIPLVVDEREPPEEQWIVYYNGTDTYWIIKDLQPITQYSFRVKARNLYGWGPYSSISEPISEPFLTSSRRDYIIVAIAIPVMVVMLGILGVCIFALHRRIPDKKIFTDTTAGLPDVELANLRELPRGANFVHNTNLLYCQGPLTDADIALLPQIRRDQIAMTSFLGSGAFGEVYEGLVNVPDEGNTRVAIKTLRKGATEQEKAEFLQEAQLMSNFKHEHILRLIGVCFDMDSLYIIMELMQGGDLLSFLRSNRPSMGNPATLSLLDLISMCVDIASGCRYLEEMHFVHRDLACRNCLVSSTDPAIRVVKIGDFGLARDIYKNDYYRKDGEGLLPVRWMSPESLVDGVFTSQSDIWAFGVLCWEIMTLGQQPYPARNNLEVLHYVRDGGRLTRPIECPDELYQLMLKCWSYRPEERPTFRYCLEVLSNLKENTCENIQLLTENLNRPSLTNGGIFNRSYLIADENHNHNKGSLKFSCNGHDRIEPSPIVTPTSSTASPNTPKYLELIYDENEDPISIITDGYEIPINDVLGTTAFSTVNSTNTDATKFVQNNVNNINKNRDCIDLGFEKERTFSSSSTVSERSVCPNNNNIKNNNTNSDLVIVSVASESAQQKVVANSKEDCSSQEALLLTIPPTTILSQDMHPKKIRPVYTNAKIEEVFSCDCDNISSSQTMM